MAENFYGEGVTITKVGDHIVKRDKKKLGPIVLPLSEDRLMEDWEESQQSEIEDYRNS